MMNDLDEERKEMLASLLTTNVGDNMQENEEPQNTVTSQVAKINGGEKTRRRKNPKLRELVLKQE